MKFLSTMECTAGWERTGRGVLCLTAAENRGFQIFSPYAVCTVPDGINFELYKGRPE